jgi:hypothetical protein
VPLGRRNLVPILPPAHPLGGGSKMGNGIYLKIAGYVDLDMVHIFAIACQDLPTLLF